MDCEVVFFLIKSRIKEDVNKIYFLKDMSPKALTAWENYFDINFKLWSDF